MGREPDSPPGQFRDVGFLKDVFHQLQLVWRLLRDPDVPIYLKLLPALAIVYVLWPVDLVPDIIPFFGQLDDASALLLGAKLLVELSPQEIVDYYLQQLKGGYVIVEPKPDQEQTIIIGEEDLE